LNEADCGRVCFGILNEPNGLPMDSFTDICDDGEGTDFDTIHRGEVADFAMIRGDETDLTVRGEHDGDVM
jgi:hypothetical protein